MLIKPRMKYIEGVGQKMAFEIGCHDCGVAHVIPVTSNSKRSTQSEHLQIKNIERSLLEAGWQWKGGWGEFRRAQCPQCQTEQKVVPLRVSAAKARAEALFDKPKEEETAMTDLALVPVREPTRAQRQLILAQLDECYLIPRGIYAGSFSDAVLAERLDMPRIWVTTLRELLYGDDDRNEADGRRMETVAELEARIGDVETRALMLLDQLSKDLDALRADIAKLKGKRP